MFGFEISRLVLAEIIVMWNVYLGNINIFKGDAAKIFKNIRDLTDDLLVSIDICVNWDY